MILRLLLMLALVPLAELTLLVWLGHATERWVPLALVMISAIAGTWLIRTRGLRARPVGPSTGTAAQGLTALAAGILLLIPGILTDLLAILFLIPATRRVMLATLALKLQRNFAFHADDAGFSGNRGDTAPRRHADGDRIIDVQVLERPPSVDD